MSRAGVQPAVVFLVTALAAGAAARAESVRLRILTQIYQDAQGTGLERPEGVACNGKSLAIADTGNGRVALFDLENEMLVSRTALTLPELPRPIRVAFRPDGGLLVLDGRARRIGRVAPAGGFEGWLEPEAPGGFTPRAVAAGADGTSYILDARAFRVLVADGAGTWVRQIALPATARSPADLTVAGDGEVWVVDGIAAALYRAGAADEAATKVADLPRERIELAHAIAADASGRLYVVDRSGGRIAILGRDGAILDVLLAQGWGQGELNYPGALCLDSAGFLFVADRENDRVQVFSTAD
jgi:streptogramin lyase